MTKTVAIWKQNLSKEWEGILLFTSPPLTLLFSNFSLIFVSSADLVVLSNPLASLFILFAQQLVQLHGLISRTDLRESSLERKTIILQLGEFPNPAHRAASQRIALTWWEKQKGSSQLMLLKKWMKNQALENLTEVFQQVCLPYLYLYHCFVLTCCSRGSLHMQNACWEVPLFIVWGFLPVPLSNSSGTHRRSKVGKWGGNPGREASVGVVFILHHVTLPVRTLGCTNEEIKGERIMAALYKITCIRRATTFGWPLEQWVPVQFQENVWDRNRKAKVT